MRERTERLLKIACMVLAALLIFQLARAVLRSNPLSRVTIPEIPALTVSTNLAAATNATASVKSTNLVAATNANVAMTDSSNQAAQSISFPTNTVSSNTVAATDPSAVSGPAGLVASPLTATNDMSASNTVQETSGVKGTEASLSNAPSGDRAVVLNPVAGSGSSNGPVAKPVLAPGMVGPMVLTGSRGMAKGADLSPAVKARVNRIYESELFGPVVRPMPMALLGIAGNVAFLRSAAGQTGLVKEGDSLGDLKLLRIGVNRVLIEQEGQKKELMIFNGYGGESLMPKPEEVANETTAK